MKRTYDQLEADNVDFGVNPEIVYNRKNLYGKGFIRSSHPLPMAILLASQGCDFRKDDIIEDVMDLYIQLSGSVDGKKNKLYMEGAGHRVAVRDTQTTRQEEGE